MTPDPRLAAAGLRVLGTAATAGGLTPAAAWQLVIALSARPAVEVADPASADADGGFLISPAGPGAFAAPWTAVRLTCEVRLAEHLTGNPGEPEFVTAAADGHAVLGVTTEEHGIWLVLA